MHFPHWLQLSANKASERLHGGRSCAGPPRNRANNDLLETATDIFSTTDD